jgi:hypothetical protein
VTTQALLYWAIGYFTLSAVLSGLGAWLMWRLEKATDELVDFLDKENRP